MSNGLVSPAPLDAFERRRLIQRRQAYQSIYHRTQRRGLAKVHAENRRHQVEVSHRHQTPIQTSDHYQYCCDHIYRFHSSSICKCGVPQFLFVTVGRDPPLTCESRHLKNEFQRIPSSPLRAAPDCSATRKEPRRTRQPTQDSVFSYRTISLTFIYCSAQLFATNENNGRRSI